MVRRLAAKRIFPTEIQHRNGAFGRDNVASEAATADLRGTAEAERAGRYPRPAYRLAQHFNRPPYVAQGQAVAPIPEPTFRLGLCHDVSTGNPRSVKRIDHWLGVPRRRSWSHSITRRCKGAISQQGTPYVLASYRTTSYNGIRPWARAAGLGPTDESNTHWSSNVESLDGVLFSGRSAWLGSAEPSAPVTGFGRRRNTRSQTQSF
jgi:hypothetical protein